MATGDWIALAGFIALFAMIALRVPIGETRMLKIADGMKVLPDDKVHNLPQLLEFGPIGVVAFDPATGWSLT